MWNEIADEEYLNSFMDAMYGFHDSCVKRSNISAVHMWRRH